MSSFITEAFTYLGVALAIVALRVYATLHMEGGLRGLKSDDYLMVLAGLLYTAETVAAYCVGAYWHGLTNSDMTPEQRAALDPNSEEYALRVGGSITQYLGWTAYSLVLWSLKGCMLIFYSRITDKVANFARLIRIGAFLLPCSLFVVICVIWFACHPVPMHWQINPDPGEICQASKPLAIIWTVVVMNILTDFYLIMIPTPMLWMARLSLRRKVFLFFMFTGGLVTTAFGLIRSVLIFTAGPQGPQLAGAWSCRETFVAFFIINLPIIYPLFVKHIRQRKPKENEDVLGPVNSYPRGTDPAYNWEFSPEKGEAQHFPR